MSNYARYRNWHMWIGLILLIPLSLMALTGFLWNHEKSLGLKKEEKEKGSYAATSMPNPSDRKPTVESSTILAQPGTWSSHAPAIDAALAEARREWGDEMELERIELKNEPMHGLVVKVKISEEAEVRPYEIIWAANTGRVVEKKGDPNAGTDWAKVVHDLHTGKIFSKKYGYFWSDSAALAILALGVTGVVLYCIPLLKKRAKQKKPPRAAVATQALASKAALKPLARETSSTAPAALALAEAEAT